jgi:hypothetical protein
MDGSPCPRSSPVKLMPTRRSIQAITENNKREEKRGKKRKKIPLLSCFSILRQEYRAHFDFFERLASNHTTTKQIFDRQSWKARQFQLRSLFFNLSISISKQLSGTHQSGTDDSWAQLCFSQIDLFSHQRFVKLHISSQQSNHRIGRRTQIRLLFVAGVLKEHSKAQRFAT